MHQLQLVLRPKRPTFRKHQIVNVFQANAERFPKNIQRIQHLLKIHQAHLPPAFLRIDNRFQSNRRAAMSSSGIEKQEIQRGLLWQSLILLRLAAFVIHLARRPQETPAKVHR
jgi:hypothetical protein